MAAETLRKNAGLTFAEAHGLAQQNGETVVPAFCAMCGPAPNSCGIYAFVKDGCLTRVAGMQESSHNKGALCAKGQAAPQWYPGIRQDTVMILHGWWQGCKELGLKNYPLLDGGANVNIMYSVEQEKAFDPLITAMSSQTLVQVKKA